MSDQKLPPLQPVYVLRGHSAQIHAVEFSPSNHRILTGDADGWIVSWSIVYKRPVAAWRAHSSAVLGLAWWTEDIVISHGRDSKLVVWNLSALDEPAFSKILPVDHVEIPDLPHPTTVPQTLHSLTVNTLNFCAFARCPLPIPPSSRPSSSSVPGTFSCPPLLLAFPHTLSSSAIDIRHLPAETRHSTIPEPTSIQDPATGLTMTLAFSSPTLLVAGYESGHILAYSRRTTSPNYYDDGENRGGKDDDTWSLVYRSRPHSQPVLSLALHPTETFWVSTSADALIAKHRLPSSFTSSTTDFLPPTHDSAPEKVVRTGHAGQQGAHFRNDGKVLATAGWDGKVRVYSGKGLKEVAVLKWHKEGCYTVGFASVDGDGEVKKMIRSGEVGNDDWKVVGSGTLADDDSKGKVMVPRVGGMELGTLARTREWKERSTHWLAAGSKDGKVSLWEIY